MKRIYKWLSAISNQQSAIIDAKPQCKLACSPDRLHNSLITKHQSPSIVKRVLLALLLSVAFANISAVYAHDDDDDDHDSLAKPTELGPYKIGYSQFMITDANRRVNGCIIFTTSAAAQITACSDANNAVNPLGRPLLLRVYYPTNDGPSIGVPSTYDAFNPLYNGVNFPGIGFPNVPFSQPFFSVNGSRQGVSIAQGNFPLVLYTHRNGAGAEGEVPLMETLASHGYIAVAIEHTGNSLGNSILGTFLSTFNYPVGYVPAVNAVFGVAPRTTAAIHSSRGGVLTTVQDLSFVIDELTGVIPPSSVSFKDAPNTVGPNELRPKIDGSKIGVYGFSSLATSGAIGGFPSIILPGNLPFPKEPRIKAAILADGIFSNDPATWASVNIPVMMQIDSLGVNQLIFPQMINSHPKYLVDVAGVLHINASNPESICTTLSSNYQSLTTNPNDLGASTVMRDSFTSLGFGLTGFGLDMFMFCDASVFAAVNPAVLDRQDPTPIPSGVPWFMIQGMQRGSPLLSVKGAFDTVKDYMPLRPEVTVQRVLDTKLGYSVAFFNTVLKGQTAYDKYLTNSKKNQKKNPLVNFVKDCQYLPDHPMTLEAGDKITFTPKDSKRYRVTFAKNQLPLVDKGTSRLHLSGGAMDDGRYQIDLPWSFHVPGPKGGRDYNRIFVGANGLITTLLPLGNQAEWASPWVRRGELMLGGQLLIAPLFLDLTTSLLTNTDMTQGVFAKVESDRVIVTWDRVKASDGNNTLNARFSMQVIIHQNGTIEMAYDNLAHAGVLPVKTPNYLRQPSDTDPTGTVGVGIDLGTVGISNGMAKAKDLHKVDPVDFRTFKAQPRALEATGIFEQFNNGYVNDPACSIAPTVEGDDGHGHGDDDD